MNDTNDDDAKHEDGNAADPPQRRKMSAALRRPTRADQAAAQIGSRLRALYDEVVDEPIPDDLQALLDQLADDDKDKS